MPDAAYYRGEAGRCRALAAAAKEPRAARHLQEMADEYALLAHEIDAATMRRPATSSTPAARQLLQPQVRPKAK